MSKARKLAESRPDLMAFIEAWRNAESKPNLIHIRVGDEEIGQPLKPLKPRSWGWPDRGVKWWTFRELKDRGLVK